MKLPFFLVFGSVVFWGLWGFFSKVAVSKIGFHAGIYYSITLFTSIVFYLLITNQLFPIKHDSTGVLFAVLAGLAGGAASILFYILLGKHPAGLIVAMTALYPIVTLILSMVFLKETLTTQQTIGFVLAMAALILLNL